MHYDTLDAFLCDLPRRTQPLQDKLRGHDALFLLKTKQGRSLYIRLDDGIVTTMDACADTPACTVTADEQALLDLICGRLNPMKAIVLRKVTIQGNPAPLMGLIALL